MAINRGMHYIRPIDIYDTFMAKEKRLSIVTMLKIARSKGILLSVHSDREELARQISHIPFDSSDIVSLYEKIEEDKKREKTTSTRIKQKIAFSNIKGAIDRLKEQRGLFDEVYTIVSNPDAPTCIIEALYYETDFSKARMLQTTKRKARIEIDSKDGTLIRFPANEKCTQIVDSIIKNIEEASDSQELFIERIELAHVTNSEQRNKFFLTLLNSLEKLPAKDVIAVKMIPMDSLDEDDEDEDSANKKEITGMIRKIAIEGQALTASPEYQGLIEKQFFISNMIWTATDTGSSPNVLVELEAGFANQQDCRDFKYSVKGTYSVEKDSGVFSMHRKQATESDRLKYLSLIEKAAQRSISELGND